MGQWSLVVAGAVGAGAGWAVEIAVSGWEFVGWGPLAGGLGCVVASTAYVKWMNGKGSVWKFYQKLMPVSLSAQQPNGTAQSEKRVYTQRTAGEIFAAIKNMTDIQIEKFAEPHIGKWIRVQSTIRDINQNENFYYVMIGKWFDPMPYLCFYKPMWRSIETMNAGDHIAAVGTIYKIEKMTMYIDRCELVELEEKDDVLRLA